MGKPRDLSLNHGTDGLRELLVLKLGSSRRDSIVIGIPVFHLTPLLGVTAWYLGNIKRRHRRHPEINEQAEIKVWLWSY